MTIQQSAPATQKGWLLLVLITVLTLAIFIVSIISLLSGWLTIFQNLFYFPDHPRLRVLREAGFRLFGVACMQLLCPDGHLLK